jgi:RNA polymerase sigma factor (sigma-70 family)
MTVNDYNACVKDWADALFRFACKCTGQESDARDVVQNSFEVLWQKKGEVQPGKEKAYLFQVAYRQSVDNYRKKAKVAFVEPPEAHYQPKSNPDLKKILDRALSQLDEQSRALVLLKDYEGYRYEEIAQITGLNDSQVKVYLHRARKTLKDYLVSVENII